MEIYSVCDFSNEEAGKLIEEGVNAMARYRATADASVAALAGTFVDLYKGFVSVVRNDPENPDAEVDGDTITLEQRCMYTKMMVRSTASLIAVAGALHSKESNGQSVAQVMDGLQNQYCAVASNRCDVFNSDLQQKGVPSVGNLYTGLTEGRFPEIIRRRLQWAKDNLRMPADVDEVMPFSKSALMKL